MMGLTEQRFLSIKFLISLLTLVFLSSCQKESYDGKLECILESVNIDKKEMNVIVGQHNGWTDSTTLIIILFEEKSMNIPINSTLKGKYKQYDIYFSQGNIDSLDNNQYKQIPNNINWYNFTPEEMDEDYISPPYDPINIQVVYDLRTNCFGEVIKGKGFMTNDFASKCQCKNEITN